jgi:septal ring factor EnvC (AmiA/AmiB activator)
MDTGSVVMTLIALLLSAVNLAIAVGRSRIKQAEVDAQALEMAVHLAERTPDLERQLRETIAQLHEARAELTENQRKVAELNEVIAAQADEIQRLKQVNQQLAAELGELRRVLQAVQASRSQPS